MTPAPHAAGDAQAGVVAAGHPLTARAGAHTLSEGGNAVDAAVSALLTSFVAEPLLYGPRRGRPPDGGGLRGCADAAGLLRADARPHRRAGAELQPIDVVVRRRRAGLPRWSRVLRRVRDAGGRVRGGAPLGHGGPGVLAAPRSEARARRRPINAQQAYIAEILLGILTSTPESRRCGHRTAAAARGRLAAQPRAGGCPGAARREGAAPFYSGDIAAAVTGWLSERGGSLTAAELASYGVEERRRWHCPTATARC